jgi:hypothetical protein
MGWQDAPVVEQPPLRIDISGSAASPPPQSQPAWMSAPAVQDAASFQEPPSLFERFGHGTNAVVEAAKQRYLMATDPAAAEAYTRKMNEDEAFYQRGRQKQTDAENAANPGLAMVRQRYGGSDIPSELGSAAMLSPAMLLPGGPVAAGITQGGIGGFFQPSKDASWWDVAKNTAVGAGIGGVLGSASRGTPAPARLTPEQQARVDAMRAVGIDNPPLPAVTRSPQDWYNYVELGKKEGRAKDVYTTAEEGINKTLSEVLPSLGGDATPTLTGVLPTLRTKPATPYANAEQARQSVAAYEADARNVASGTYEAAAKAPGSEASFPAEPFFKRIESVVNDFEDAIPGAVMTRLRQLKAGMDMSRGVETPGTVPRDFTIAEATKLYQLINDRMSTGPAAAAGRAMKSALADVGESAAGPTVPQAGNVAMQLFKDATSQWRTMKQTLEPAPLAKLADTAEAHPDFYPRLFTSGKPEEIVALRKFLQENNPAAASGMRDALLGHLQDAATKSGSFDAFAMNDAIKRVGSERLAAVLDAQEIGHLTALVQTGMRESVLNSLRSAAMQQNGRFSGVMLGRAMDRIGPERLRAVLSPADLATLQNLRVASHALTVEPNLANVNRSNTGSTLGNMLQRFHVGPMAGAGLGALFGPHTGLPQFVPEMAGAALGAIGERFGANAAGRRMQGMVNPDLQALARSQQPQASMLAQLLTQQRTPMQRALPMLGLGF